MFSKLFKKKETSQADRRMLYPYKTCNLIISLQSGWIEYKLEDPQISDPLTFVKDKNGVGALQISLSTAENGEKFSIKEALKRNKQEIIAHIKQYKVADLDVYEYQEEKDNRYTRFFYLTRENVIVFVTYNCDKEKKDAAELKDAEEMIRSIRVSSGN